MLLLYALGGRAVIDRVRRSARGHVVERTLGVVLIATGVLMAANLDVRFEEALAKSQSLPAFLLDPDPVAGELERGPEPARVAATRSRGSPRASARPRPSRCPTTAGVSIPGVKTPSLPDLGPAPDFTDTQQWFNTPGGAPLTLATLRGHVVLVDFWTYTCINCIRTLPFVEGLYTTYHRYGLEIVGVETPEFTFEQNASNVKQAIRSDGLTYPVVQDNQLRHLERLAEPVLAGGVPDRRQGQGPPRPVRRGRLQGGRGRGPRSCCTRRARAGCRRR